MYINLISVQYHVLIVCPYTQSTFNAQYPRQMPTILFLPPGLNLLNVRENFLHTLFKS